MPMRPLRSATTMLCIGATQSRAAATNSSSVRARLNASATPTASMSASSAVQRIDIAKRARSRPTTSSAVPASEMTGPWRLRRTVMLTSSPPRTRMTSCAVSNAAQPSGVR